MKKTSRKHKEKIPWEAGYTTFGLVPAHKVWYWTMTEYLSMYRHPGYNAKTYSASLVSKHNKSCASCSKKDAPFHYVKKAVIPTGSWHRVEMIYFCSRLCMEYDKVVSVLE